MISPIVLDYFGDILIFQTVAEAEAYAEAIDAANGEFVAYDSVGMLIDVDVTRSGSVALNQRPQAQVVGEDVVSRIRAFLQHAGMEGSDLKGLGIRELITLVEMSYRARGTRRWER